MALPPPVWQRDALRSDPSAQQPPAAGALRAASNCDHDQTAEAYRHVKLVTADGRRDFDLHDLLLSTRREETFQPYHQGVRAARGRVTCAWH